MFALVGDTSGGGSGGVRIEPLGDVGDVECFHLKKPTEYWHNYTLYGLKEFLSEVDTICNWHMNRFTDASMKSLSIYKFQKNLRSNYPQI